MPRMTWLFSHPALLAALILIALGVGCGSNPDPVRSRAPQVKDTPFTLESEGEFDPIADRRAVKGGTFTTWAGGYPKSLNMWLDYNSFSKNVCELLFESLVGLHPSENRPVGILAERWEISPDGTTFTFHLNPQAKWSDGVPITARDVQFYFDTLMNPKHLTSLFRVSLSRFERPEILGTHSIRIRAQQPHWSNFWVAGGLSALPAHAWENKNFNDIHFDLTPVSGPYQLYEVQTNRSINLQRRGDWWARHLKINQYKHNFDYLRFRALEDRNKALELLKRGDFDLFPVYTARIWARQTDFLQVKKNWIVRQSVSNREPKGFQGFALNLRRPHLQDPRVRTALAHLLNRRMMMEKIMFDAYFLLNSYYPDLYPDNLNPDAPLIEYDPAQARSLLAQAGWSVGDRGVLTREGVPFELVILYHGTPIPQLTIYLEDLKKVGIDARIETVSLAAYRKRLDQHEFDLAWQNWSGNRLRDPEPMWHSKTVQETATQNISGVNSPRIDALIEKQKDLFDIDARNEILRQIDRELTAIQPYVLLWQSDRHRLLYWNRFGMPETVLDHYNREDAAMVYWWHDEKKDAELRQAMSQNQPLPEAAPEILVR
ncbi:MAG: extracellular solute-binding protein [Candidatus Methylacidiphilales bacterium]